MMFLLSLVRKSLANRLLATSLTLASIALSVALLLGIENVRAGMRESFSNTISRTDLIVGARGGSLQLLLYSVFGIGSPTNNVSWETYEHFRDHPAVAWTIPISLGDSHRGFRVAGTDSSFYQQFHYGGGRSIEFAEGRMPQTDHEVVLGDQVARELEYTVGSDVVITHGLYGSGIMDHDEQPFRVVGILERTFTPVDRSLYVTLQGIDAVHEGFMEMPGAGGPGGPPSFAPPPNFAAPDIAASDTGAVASTAPAETPGTVASTAPAETAGTVASAAPVDDPDATDSAEGAAPEAAPAQSAADTPPEQITAFFLGARTRIATLQLQREINTYEAEATMAILPGVALAEMWRGVGYAEDALLVVTFFVVAVGLIGMLLSLYSSLEARRREMAILRAVGAGAPRIFALLVLESGLLGLAGALTGVALIYALLVLLKGFIESNFGLYLPIQAPTRTAYLYLVAVVAASFLIGIVPALRAYRNSLADGLTVRM
ncbi:MAG TPA: FtsX-like permease family protein [Longimicrobiales bacterium]|nr:FtsX-like permease family protein [Longimicrobiales bacterium]